MTDPFIFDDSEPWAPSEVYANIRESWRAALPTILAGADPEPMAWGPQGQLQAWNDDTPSSMPRALMDQGFVCAAVLSAICKATGLSKTQLCSGSRQRSLARPRQVACFLMARLSQRSLTEIGLFLGGRDHTTVIHAKRVIQKKVDEGDEQTCTIYRDAKRILGV